MQEKQTTPPAKCPVCGSVNLYASNRKSISAPPAQTASGILSYRCENGHVFMPPADVA